MTIYPTPVQIYRIIGKSVASYELKTEQICSTTSSLCPLFLHKMLPDLIWSLTHRAVLPERLVSPLLSSWTHSLHCVCPGCTTEHQWLFCEKTSHIPDSQAQPSHHEMRNISISSAVCISRLQPRNCVRGWILVSMLWKQQWQYRNIAKFVPSELHEHSHRNRKNTTEPIQGWRWQLPG